MTEIKKELKEIIEEKMIPECESYLEDLHKIIGDKTADEDDMEAIKEMESFLVELQNILQAIEENEINDEDAKIIFEKLLSLLNTHEE